MSTGRIANKSSKEEFGNFQITALETQAFKELYELLPSKFSSYPVPLNSGETATLVIMPEVTGKTNITLYDVQGRKITNVYDGALTAGELLELEVDFGKLNIKSGLYYYKMISENGEKTHSVIVQ